MTDRTDRIDVEGPLDGVVDIVGGIWLVALMFGLLHLPVLVS